MLRCTPFLLFDGNCAEAMKFYKSCLGGKLTLTKLGDSPMKDSLPTDKHERIINAQLQNRLINISATDWMASPALEPVRGNMSAVFVVAKTDAELRTAFDKLSRGAQAKWFQDLHAMPFGMYGQFFDKFGVQWIFRGPSRAGE
jgi:PhnB protein